MARPDSFTQREVVKQGAPEEERKKRAEKEAEEMKKERQKNKLAADNVTPYESVEKLDEVSLEQVSEEQLEIVRRNIEQLNLPKE